MWLEGRQELVTSSSDGSIRFSSMRKHYKVLLSGRRLIPSFVRRMTVKTDWQWMTQLCADEAEDRLFAVMQMDVLVWSCAKGELLQRFSSMHEVCLIADAATRRTQTKTHTHTRRRTPMRMRLHRGTDASPLAPCLRAERDSTNQLSAVLSPAADDVP